MLQRWVRSRRAGLGSIAADAPRSTICCSWRASMPEKTQASVKSTHGSSRGLASRICCAVHTAYTHRGREGGGGG
eukprot:109404-Prymnesium_polylepis.1